MEQHCQYLERWHWPPVVILTFSMYVSTAGAVEVERDQTYEERQTVQERETVAQETTRTQTLQVAFCTHDPLPGHIFFIEI